MRDELTKAAYKTTEEVLNSNPKISKLVVFQYHELEKQLEEVGVDTRSRYTLSPPFGGIISNLQEK